MVIYRNGHHLLGVILTYHVIIQKSLNLVWWWDILNINDRSFLRLGILIGLLLLKALAHRCSESAAHKSA